MAMVRAKVQVAADDTNATEVDRNVPLDGHAAGVSTTEQSRERRRESFPVFHVGPWPEDLPLRRKDMYGDDGR
jgi:hypothetical protein